VTTALEKAQAKAREMREAAINGKCWDCQGGQSDPGIRERIGTCPVASCCLHPVRPYQRGEGEEG